MFYNTTAAAAVLCNTTAAAAVLYNTTAAVFYNTTAAASVRSYMQSAAGVLSYSALQQCAAAVRCSSALRSDTLRSDIASVAAQQHGKICWKLQCVASSLIWNNNLIVTQ